MTYSDILYGESVNAGCELGAAIPSPETDKLNRPRPDAQRLSLRLSQ